MTIGPRLAAALAAGLLAAGPAAAGPVAEDDCSIQPIDYSFCDVARRASACDGTPPWSAVREALELYAGIDRRIPVNLAKAGVKLRLDFHDRHDDSLDTTNAAEYNPHNKTVLLRKDGHGAVHELAHALDDTLKTDDILRAIGAFFDGATPAPVVATLPQRLDHAKLAGQSWSATDKDFQEAFLESFDEAYSQSRAIPHGSARYQTRIWETFAHGMESYLNDKTQLNNRLPLLARRLEEALLLFAELDETRLFEARLESAPLLGLEEREDLRRDFQWDLRHGKLSKAETLEDYCAENHPSERP